MNPYLQAVEELYALEDQIFKEFATETGDNIHVKAVDLDNPLASICKIYLSDIISSQLQTQRKTLPAIIPTMILARDNKEDTYCLLQLCEEGIEKLAGYFKRTGENTRDAVLNEFRSSVLTEGDFFHFCDNWTGKDMSVLSDDFKTAVRLFEEKDKIVYRNPQSGIDYDIFVKHTLSGDNAETLRSEQTFRFLSKLSVLALHTRRNRKMFSDIEGQATRAAIADILNRNYAHHIGSHVSHRSAFDNVLRRLSINPDSLTVPEMMSVSGMRSRLEKYKDDRSEFIAGVTGITGYQSFYFYGDIIRPFIENTLLTDNIAANEGIRYFGKKEGTFDRTAVFGTGGHSSLSQLVIRVFIDNSLAGKNIPYEAKSFRTDLSPVPCGYTEQKVIYFLDKPHPKKINQAFDSTSVPYFLNSPHSDNDSFCEHAEPVLCDILISLPGALGRHAIYSLLENYIRNTAKHAYREEAHANMPVEILITLRPDKEHADKIVFEITDNISDAGADSINEHGERVTVLQRLQTSISADVTEKKGMGIADMKISACLLAEKTLTEKNLKQALEAGASPDGHISFSLRLTKPGMIALIGCLRDRALPAEGIFFFRDTEYFIRSAEANFQFAIIGGEEALHNNPSKYKNLLPLRLFLLDIPAESRLVIPGDIPRFMALKEEDLSPEENLRAWCWQNWVTFKTGARTTELAVYFQQTPAETPTKNWAAKERMFAASTAKLKIYHKYARRRTDTEGRQLLYDRHAELIKANSQSFLRDNFWELVDKRNPDFDLLFSAPTEEPFTLPYEMIDAAMLRLLVIDERVAEVSGHNLEDAHLHALCGTPGFGKLNSQDKVTLFDYCWAANVYVATQINGTDVHPHNTKSSCAHNHLLDIQFEERKGTIDISYKTNFISLDHRKESRGLDNGWVDKNGTAVTQCVFQDGRRTGVLFDCMLIHRTKLKELAEKYGQDFTARLNIAKVYVITGGGTVDFLQNSQDKLTVLPTNILRDFIMNGRIAKLRIANMLK